MAYRDSANESTELAPVPTTPKVRWVVMVGKRYVVHGSATVDRLEEAHDFGTAEAAATAALFLTGRDARAVRVQYTETELTNEQHREALRRAAEERWPG